MMVSSFKTNLSDRRLIDVLRQSLLWPLLFGGLVVCLAYAQDDPLLLADKRLKQATRNKVYFTFEERTRWEEKFGVNFGKSVNQHDMLSRLRIGLGVAPTNWISFYVMGQDTRSPFYPGVAPNNLRDTMDLQESYIKLFDSTDTGFGASVGRAMLDYGESRVIGSPQWTNVARTYDHGRLYYRLPKMRFEVLMVSPVKVLPDAFNKPDLGERIWGTYNVFPSVWHGASIDGYALRHSQNKIGGWVGPGTLGTETFGGRLYGPLPLGFAYSFEGIGQTGHLGLAKQRAFAWFVGASQRLTALNRPLSLSIEYKAASGSGLGSATSGTYDQLAPANHDKFGHLDLFGWRNLRTFRSLETFGVTKGLTLNLMYSDNWLFSPTDALYNSSGAPISVSSKGTAGVHVGRELDCFATYKYHAHTFGVGVGHFFKGEFVANTTSHINPRYFYVFQQYSFK